MKEIHASPIGRHADTEIQYRKVKQFINWQGMKSDVEKCIRECKKCQKNEMAPCHTRMPLMITDTPSTVFEKFSIDIICPFCPSRSKHRTDSTRFINVSDSSAVCKPNCGAGGESICGPSCTEIWGTTTSQLLMLSRSPKTPGVISITSSLKPLQMLDSMP